MKHLRSHRKSASQKKGATRSSTHGLRRSPDELALQRDWFYESIRLVNDQVAAMAAAKEVPLTYLKFLAKAKRSA